MGLWVQAISMWWVDVLLLLRQINILWLNFHITAWAISIIAEIKEVINVVSVFVNIIALLVVSSIRGTFKSEVQVKWWDL